MLRKYTFLAALLFTVTVSSVTSATAPPPTTEPSSTTDDKYNKVSMKLYGMCDQIQAMVDARGTACYADFLNGECACLGDAVRNVTGSQEQDDAKLIADNLSTSCSKNSQDYQVMYVKILKTEYDICKITPEQKLSAVKAAVKHCSNKCPYKEGNKN